MEPPVASHVGSTPSGAHNDDANTKLLPHGHWTSLVHRIERAKGAAAKLALAKRFVADAASGSIMNFFIAASHFVFKNLYGTCK